MKYGIVIFPSKKVQDLANSYRKRYDPHYALITPHLTLKSPFEATDEEINVIANAIREVAKSTDPIELTIKKFSSFSPVNNVIYLKVEPTEEILSLHKALHSGKLESNPEYSFVPHITIGQKLSDDEHSDVLGSLKMMNIEQSETIDRFHLLYQLENGSWTVYETFRLGKDLE
ncbi:YjcG family protein [Metabacillus arenae]|uniref:Putative phosphoesterase IC621_17145 n=1 Tax=Metabacillus arenae TaxID=2771434 RepID=A0A926NQ15_9BACI|nr:YjcG family protein [Metabacillus arenae]MBD1381957.1 2'-5' RNA ligase family protein [Metabacillus arenae]